MLKDKVRKDPGAAKKRRYQLVEMSDGTLRVRSGWAYAYILPAMALLLLFTVYPLVREWRHKTLGNGVLICGFTSGRDNILLRARNSRVLLTVAEVTRSVNYCCDSRSYRYHWVRGYLN